MRISLVFSGFLDVLARWLALHRNLEERGQESVELFRNWDGQSTIRRYHSSRRPMVASTVMREMEAVTAALSDVQGVTDAEFEACLPQVTRLLLDYAPRVPTSVRRRTLTAYDPRSREYVSYSTTTISSEQPEREPSASEILTSKLREALVARCSRSSQLGLQACWLLQDALATKPPMEWGTNVARDCWRAASSAGDGRGTRDTAAFVASLVRVSEALAKVDRSKRRERERLIPLLEAMNAWLAPRAADERNRRGAEYGAESSQYERGVRIPLCPLSDERQLRILRLDVDSCEVMPSRARAPTLLYCEALDIPETDPVFSRGSSNNNDAPPPSITSKVITSSSCDAVRSSASSILARRLVSLVYAPAIWETREERLRKTSPFGNLPGWRLASFLVKADDELRREQLAMQFVRLCSDIFAEANVDGWLRPYSVICAGTRAGLVETLADAKSLTHVKTKLSGEVGSADLSTYFDIVYQPSGPVREQASLNFAKSLAAYSLVCYALDLKDRHNGNIMLDRDGHLIHIDFGYMLGLSPGNIGFETAPFKLTDDYVKVMGGFDSYAWDQFLRTFAKGLHALSNNLHKLQNLVALFFGDDDSNDKGSQQAAEALARRFAHLTGRDPQTAVAFAMRLVEQALSNDRTRQYDWYQWKTNGIIM